MSRRLISLALAASLLLGACSTTPVMLPEVGERGDYQPVEKYVSWLIERDMAESEITGYSIALIDDQELDSRRSVGAIYWEGAVRCSRNGQVSGEGYLELTGYGDKIRVG